jgi:hypothetical protein
MTRARIQSERSVVVLATAMAAAGGDHPAAAGELDERLQSRTLQLRKSLQLAFFLQTIL